MRARAWIHMGAVVASLALGQLGCAEALGLLDRPVDDDTGGTGAGTTTTSSTTSGTTGQGGGAAPTCDDDAKNGVETDVDCGGGCEPCGSGQKCQSGEDCKSNVCSGLVCAPTCFDRESGGDETDVDCGGPTCGACANGQSCEVPDDCQSRLCQDSVCADPFVWARSFGGAGFQWMTGVAIDDVDRTIFTGFFDGVVDFGGGDLSSPSDYNGFVAKLDVDGTHLWSKSFGTGGDQKVNAVSAGPQGAVSIAGTYEGNADFGGGPVNSTDGTDIFVAKFSATGQYKWSHTFGGTGAQLANTVVLNGLGQTIVAGSFQSTVNFEGGALNSAGGSDAYLVRFNMDGYWQWNKQLGGKDQEYVSSIASTPSNDLLAVGSFQGTLDLGGGPVDSAGGYDGFVIKYDPNGNHLWSARFGGVDNDLAPVVAADKAGNVLIAGAFTDVVDLGCGQHAAVGDQDIFIAKLDPDGVCLWTKTFPGAILPRIAVDSNGRIGLTGRISAELDIGFDKLQGPAMFLLKLDSEGIPLWGRSFTDPQGTQMFQGIAFDSINDARVAGQFTSTIDLGGGKLVAADGQDLVLGRLMLP